MRFYTETVCTSLDDLDKVEAIRAIHQAYLQLTAIVELGDPGHFDNAPALVALRDCLKAAGHPAGDRPITASSGL